MNQPKIAIILVTFDRLELLKKVYEALIFQTEQNFNLYIINNASRDGTEQWLNNLEDKRAHIFHLPENLGGAGGFAYGLETAYNTEQYNWYWLLDDDVQPFPKCLKELLSFSSLSKCIHPRRLLNDGSIYKWGGIFDKRLLQNDFSYQPNGEEKFFFTSVGCFEGMLIAHELIKKIGFPEKDYFIRDDDEIYGFLASQHTNVICTKEALMQRMNPLSHHWTTISAYHYARNKFLSIRVLSKKHQTIPFLQKIQILLNHFFKTANYFFKEPLAVKKFFFLGFIDGMIGNFGSSYFKHIKKKSS